MVAENSGMLKIVRHFEKLLSRPGAEDERSADSIRQNLADFLLNSARNRTKRNVEAVTVTSTEEWLLSLLAVFSRFAYCLPRPHTESRTRPDPAHGYQIEYLSYLWGQPELEFVGIDLVERVRVSVDVGSVEPGDYAGLVLIGAYAMDRLRYQASPKKGQSNQAPAVAFIRRAMQEKARVGTISLMTGDEAANHSRSCALLRGRC